MKKTIFLLAILSLGPCVLVVAGAEERIREVAETPGLIAFWDFSTMSEGKWTSWRDETVVSRSYPILLRRIGDPQAYTPTDWPYDDEQSRLEFDTSGPFGHAVRFNQGYIFAEVPRGEFDGTPLDIHGRTPFTLIAWTQFVGRRHMVAGIWDEGGWDKYGGRRQVALFGGLFGSQGVIGHISATGAASYPQSTASGSQYARLRAIDGRGFANNEWVALAMTFDPATERVTVYSGGVATPSSITDPVAKDVFRYEEPVASNPYHFPWPIYSPRRFVLKFHGYNVQTSGVYEHWLEVDVERGTVLYDRSASDDEAPQPEYRVTVNVLREDTSLLESPVTFSATRRATVELPLAATTRPGDEIIACLEVNAAGQWRPVGQTIRYRLREGAPFTFGRALGLGNEAVDHGTQLYLDGVAVFNRVLSEEELLKLAFVDDMPNP